MADVQRDAALAGIFIVELPAHIGIAHAGKRPGRGIARGTAAERRHGSQSRIGIVLPFHLEALRPHSGEETGAAGGSEKPGEIEDLYPLQRNGLLCNAESLGFATTRGSAG